jgi:hypothetical protein
MDSRTRTLLSTVTNCMPPCRPSFVDTIIQNEKDEQNKFDRHFWSHLPSLTKPCAFCKRKSMSSSFFGTARPSTMPMLDIMTNGMIYNKSPIPGSPKLPGSSSGLQCLWCSRCYHRRCWEQVFNEDDKNKCDYGIFR